MGDIISTSDNYSIENSNEQTPENMCEYDFDSPRFSVNNSNELADGVKYLEENGYAVFGDILSRDEIVKNIGLFWDYVEGIRDDPKINRKDHRTWDNMWPGSHAVGLVNTRGIGQTQFMWSVRGNPNVKKVFSQIWNSNELLVSFDGSGCFRDWTIDASWKTHGNWFHCDQSPLKKPDRCSIQGLVSLTDSDKSTGGLVVVPGSLKRFTELQAIQNPSQIDLDYISVPKGHKIFNQLKPRLVNCKAGDLVVWDSRTIHCNTPGLDSIKRTVNPPEAKGLLRLVTYICMSPASMFEPSESSKTYQDLIELRMKCVKTRTTCAHWPLSLVTGDSAQRQRLPLKLNKFQQSLITGENVEYEANTEEIDF